MKNTTIPEAVDTEAIHRLSVHQEKKQIKDEIKSLQRDLIKISFNQSSESGSHAELILAINKKRAQLKKLNSMI